jgi:hypothetical protein
MRYTKLLLALLGFAATLCAADPFSGVENEPRQNEYKAGTAKKNRPSPSRRRAAFG